MAGAGGSPSGGSGGMGGSAGNAGGGAGGASGSGGSGGTLGGAGGTGGVGGSGGSAGDSLDSGLTDADVDLDGATDATLPDDAGEPGTCNMAFIAAGKCDPEITFVNDEADGDGAMFDQVIPDPVAALSEIACQVCTILYRDPSEVTKQPDAIHLHIYDFDGVANAGGGNVNFSSRHIQLRPARRRALRVPRRLDPRGHAPLPVR